MATKAWVWSLSLMGLLLLGMAGGCTNKSDDDETGLDPIGTVLGILISPEKVILPLGESAQLTATGLMENRTSRDLTHYVEWVSMDPDIVEMNNGLDAEGTVTGLKVGATTVRAFVDEVESVDVTVEVTEATLVGLVVEPDPVTVEVGQTVQLQAHAAFSDGNRSDAAAQVRWVTSSGAVAQVSGGGKLTGQSIGSAEVRAIWGEVESRNVDVSVKEASRPDIVITSVTGESSDTLLILTVGVSNTGGVGATDFFVDVFLDTGVPEVGDFGDDWLMVEYLGPDEEKQYTFTFELSRGEHSVHVFADSLDTVEEKEESNNIFGTSVDVGSGVSGPNLTFEKFQFVADSESVYYAIDVLNNGSEDVGEFYVDLFLDSWSEPALETDGDAYVDVLSLAAGESTYADFFFAEPCNYCYTWIIVDSYNEIEETREDDNIAGAAYVIPD